MNVVEIQVHLEEYLFVAMQAVSHPKASSKESKSPSYHKYSGIVGVYILSWQLDPLKPLVHRHL